MFVGCVFCWFCLSIGCRGFLEKSKVSLEVLVSGFFLVFVCLLSFREGFRFVRGGLGIRDLKFILVFSFFF